MPVDGDEGGTTLCAGYCSEEVPVSETSACPNCGLDPLCETCIGEFDHDCNGDG